MTSFLKWAKWLDQDEVTEAVIRQVISPSSQVKGNVYTDYGGQVGGTVWNGLARAGGTLEWQWVAWLTSRRWIWSARRCRW